MLDVAGSNPVSRSDRSLDGESCVSLATGPFGLMDYVQSTASGMHARTAK